MPHIFTHIILFTTLILLPRQIDKMSPIAAEAEIVIRISGIHNSKGQVIISVYDGPEGFPKERNPQSTHRFIKSRLRNGELNCRFLLPPGEYAFAVLDDEDMDGDMRFNFAGIPREGFGFSNNPNPLGLRPPSFKECVTTIKTGRNHLSIHLNYMLKKG